MDNITEIGVATMTYDESGRPKSANFQPAAYVSGLLDVADDLVKDSQSETVKDAKQQAEVVLADWFVHIGGIEIADREEGKIESEIVSCEEWGNGRPKTCVIRFYFAKRNR